MSAARPTPARTALLLLLVLLVLLGVGRMAMEAWQNRETPSTLPEIGARTDTASPFLLVILDGLREGTSWLEAQGPMPRLRALAAEGASGIAITGEPTLTAACVRALVSGRRPDLLTGFRNFDAPPVRGTLIEYLARRGARTAHAGDAAAWQIARAWYPPTAVYAVPDRGPVDQGETDAVAVPFLLDRIDAGDDALTLHLTRIDHAGHKHGALGAAYAEACAIVDAQVDEVVARFRARHPEGTVLVASDHGVSAMGTHGGGERAARRAPFLLVGPGVARTGPVETDQSALAPTVATLLGLPMPPLADAPPDLALVDLPPAIERAARLAYLEARIAVARHVQGDAVDYVERQRAELDAGRLADEAAAWRSLVDQVNELLEPRRLGFAALAWLLLAVGMAVVIAGVEGLAPPALPRLGERGLARVAAALLVLDLVVLGALPPPFSVPSVVAAVLTLLGLAVGAACLGAPGPRTWSGAAAALVLVPVLTGAGYVFQEAFTLREDPGVALERLGIVGGFALGLFVAFARPRVLLPRLRSFADRHPTATVALLGGPLGFLVTLRPFVDNLVHTVVLFALFALLVVVLWLRALRPAPASRLGAGVVALTALVLFGVLRVAEGLLGGNWVKLTVPLDAPWLWTGIALTLPVVALAPRAAWVRSARLPLGLAGGALALAYVHRLVGTDALEAGLGVAGARGIGFGVSALALTALALASRRRVGADARLLASVLAALALARRLSVMDAEHAAFVLVAVGAMGAARLPIRCTRVRIAWAALGLVVLRTAVFHAMGFEESFSTLDVGQAFAGLGGVGAPAATDAVGATGVSWQIVAAGLQLVLRMAVPWVLFLAAVRRMIARTPPASLATGRQLVTDVAIAGAARAALVVASLWAWWRNTWWMGHAYTVYAYAAADIILLAVIAALLGFLGPDGEGPEPVGCPA